MTSRASLRLLRSSLAAALLGLAGSAAAHGGGNARVLAELGPLPPALAGVRVEVHRTVSAQLVIENTTGRTVEILDDEGVPFLRVGRDGAFGNFAARAWYATYAPGLPAPAEGKAGGAPSWVRVSAEPSFGWFDPRLDTSEVEVPHALIDSGRAGEVGRWTLPLRVDGKTVALVGRFRYEPPAAGEYVSRLTSPAEIAPGVRVRLLRGGVPGLMVESARPLTVFGEGGEPFLRFGATGVEANLRSPTWRASARASRGAAASADEKAGPEWRKVASGHRFAWIEPRAGASESENHGGEPQQWEVPIEVGEERVAVTGEVAWRAFRRGG